MKFIEEYRDRSLVHRLSVAIAATATRQWTLMEICGGQTHAIVRHGLDQLLPDNVRLIHGPGCPVCVTPIEVIDQAQALAAQPGTTLCSFGDMLRVPGHQGDLLAVKAAGGDVRMVYSPLDAVRLAQREPWQQIIFLAVGFETTAPANATAVLQAQRLGLTNFSLLVSQVQVPPAIEAILARADNQVQGFLAAGHVCTVTGDQAYRPLAARYRVPIVVTGFEPADILLGVLRCIEQLESGRAEVANGYDRIARTAGNPAARQVLARVFETVDRRWRGMGIIPASGLALRPEYAGFDAEVRFGAVAAVSADDGECIAGDILRGTRTPHACPAFGNRCTPQHPLGAPMVSSEGACAAYYRYRREPNAA